MRSGHPDDWTDRDGLVLVVDDDGEERWVDQHALDAERELGVSEWLADEADLTF